MIKKKNDEILGEVLRRMFARGKMGDRLRQDSIRHIWERRMGESIAGRTGKIHLYKGELRIEITSAALRNELYHRQEEIRAMINKELEEEVIHTVIIR